MMNSRKPVFYVSVLVLVMPFLACNDASKSTPGSQNTSASAAVFSVVDRETKIPPNAVKMSPETDEHPPLVYTSDYEVPVPMPGAVNTAGAEDSPFITSDGNTLYFFFTPDVSVPVEKRILDGVTGIYMSHKMRSRLAL